MTPAALTELHRAELDYYRSQYPSVPAMARPRTAYTDSNTNGLTRCVMDYIRFTGNHAERVNTTGRQIKAKSGKRIWIPTPTTNGSADLHCIIHGRPAMIEIKCKATGDRIRPDQVRYAEKVTRAGGLYFVARTFEEFLTWYQSL